MIFFMTNQQLLHSQGVYSGVNAEMYCDMINNNVLLVFKNDQKPEKCAL